MFCRSGWCCLYSRAESRGLWGRECGKWCRLSPSKATSKVHLSDRAVPCCAGLPLPRGVGIDSSTTIACAALQGCSWLQPSRPGSQSKPDSCPRLQALLTDRPSVCDSCNSQAAFLPQLHRRLKGDKTVQGFQCRPAPVGILSGGLPAQTGGRRVARAISQTPLMPNHALRHHAAFCCNVMLQNNRRNRDTRGASAHAMCMHGRSTRGLPRENAAATVGK